jgi:hypothetical protein
LGVLVARLAGAGLGAKGFLGFFGRSAEIDNGEAVFAFGLGWLPIVADVSFAVRAVDGGIVPVVACGSTTAPGRADRKSAFDRATATERTLSAGTVVGDGGIPWRQVSNVRPADADANIEGAPIGPSLSPAVHEKTL